MYEKTTDRELVKEVQSGNEEAFNTLLERYNNLIYNLINRFSYRGDKDDLYQVACLGLYKAINKFDLKFNNKLSTYVFPVVLGEIKRYIRDNRTIKVSREIISVKLKLDKVIQLLQEKYEREPTIEEVSNHLGVNKELVLEAMNYPSSIISLDKPIETNDNSVSMYELISGFNDQEWFDKVAIKSEVEKLTDFERMIIHLRYVVDLTQSDVAKRLNVSQVQVSRTEKKIIDKLRERLVKI